MVVKASEFSEIQRKAKAGISMSAPTAQKTALYDYFKKNPNAGPVDSRTLGLIQSKANSGTALSAPTAQKTALYNAFKPTATTQPQPTVPTVPTTPGVTTPKLPTGPASMQGPVDNGRDNWNSNQSRPDFLGMTPEMIQKALAGLTGGGTQFDPTTDPSYLAMQKLNETQTNKASQQSMELMNERGILNSTVTADRLGQIKQSGSDALLGLIPGMQANHQNQQANNQAGLQNLLNSVLGAGQFQQNFSEGNRQFDKGFQLDEAAVTGRYMPAEAQDALRSLFEAKAIAEDKNLTPQQKQALSAENSKKAALARQTLSTLGVDITPFASNVKLADAMKNAGKAGMTLEAQGQYANQDLAKKELQFKKDSFGREMNFTEQDALIKNDLAARGLDLEQLRINISDFTAKSDAEYKKFQQSSGLSEETTAQNTNMAIGEAMKATSAADALEFLSESASSWAASGVDVRKVLDAVNQRFPELKALADEGGTTTGDYGTP